MRFGNANVKIIHLIDSLAGTGGAEQGLVREITRFSHDHAQIVVRLFENDDLGHLLTAANIDDRWLDLTRRSALSAYPLGVKRLVTMIRAEKPDLIHTSLFAANVVGQVAGRLTGTTVLSTFTLSGERTLLESYQPDGATRKAKLLRKAGALTARSKNVYFRAVSKDAADTNAHLLGIDRNRVTVIPRGVPTTLRPDTLLSRNELGLPEDARIIVNVGREVAQKGQIHLLAVFARLRTEHPDLHLAICGRTGEITDELTRLTTTLGLEGHVTRMGYTDLALHVVAHADLFVFPSLMEGLGTAVLESMSIGTPVVAFDIAPVRETVGADNAVLVPVGDEDALYRECHRLLDNPGARATLIDAGRVRVENDYPVLGIAHRVEALLEKTAALKRDTWCLVRHRW